MDIFYVLVKKKLLKFSMSVIFQRNNSHDGVYVVGTGKDDSTQTNVIQTFNGMKYLPYWSTPESNMINGTGEKINYVKENLRCDEESYISFLLVICAGMTYGNSPKRIANIC